MKLENEQDLIFCLVDVRYKLIHLLESKFDGTFSFLPTDLSECQLMQVPDAVYHLMRHTELKTCDLSGNVITKIPPKFATKFSLITGKQGMSFCNKSS